MNVTYKYIVMSQSKALKSKSIFFPIRNLLLTSPFLNQMSLLIWAHQKGIVLITNALRWQALTGLDCPRLPAQNGRRRCSVTSRVTSWPLGRCCHVSVTSRWPCHRFSSSKKSISDVTFGILAECAVYSYMKSLLGGWDVVHKTLFRMLWKCNSLSSIYLNLICFVPCHTY